MNRREFLRMAAASVSGVALTAGAAASDGAAVKVCPVCGAINPGGAKACGNCRWPLGGTLSEAGVSSSPRRS